MCTILIHHSVIWWYGRLAGLALSRARRARSHLGSLGSWEFHHGEPSHERATTQARPARRATLLGSLGRLAEPLCVTYISCVSAQNRLNCMLRSTNSKSPQPKVFSEFRLPFQQLDTRHLGNGHAASGLVWVEWKHFPKHRWTHCQIARKLWIAPSKEQGLGTWGMASKPAR